MLNSRRSVLIQVFLFAMIPWFASDGATQARLPQRPDPQAQLISNYSLYPDRYIRISKEAWKYDEAAHCALHSFEMKNIAGVAYSGIEIRLIYQRADGKVLRSQVAKIPGILAAYELRKIRDLKVSNVPAGSDQVLVSVTKATIHP